MPNPSSPDLRPLIAQFVSRVVSLVNDATDQRVRGLVSTALGPSRGARPATALAPLVATGDAPSLVMARPKRPLSPKAARARRLQGQYLGALRSLTPDQRKRVTTLARDKGVPEALKLARSFKA